MAFGFFRRGTQPNKHVRRVPDATRVYAIGDIHGCHQALDKMLALIDDEVRSLPGRIVLVFLGDLIDRGPDSALVVERLSQGPLPGTESHVLMGNHEEAMLSVIDGSADPRAWLSYGGMQTLESYGIARSEHFARGFDLGRRIAEAVPAEHIAFLRSLPDRITIGDYLFVHAGIRPGVPLERQESTDLRWIRAGFIDSDADHGLTVVHGHTISEAPQSMVNRIGIDTGCYAGGALTALVLEGSTQRFLQVAGPRGD
ncbi:MAG: metallophosphoesterase family protein [Sphingomicrobium sp.]